MAYFNNNRSGGGRGNFGGGRSFDRPQMHKAVCSNCGKECEVPFRPTGAKPVLCRDCFAQNGGADSRRSYAPPTAGNYESRRPMTNDRRMYDAVCDNCGKNCRIPFEPTSGRPVFCSNCFETNGQTTPRRSESGRASGPDYKAQFDALNAKMDQILALLTPATPKKAKVAAVTEDVTPVVEEEAKTPEVETVDEEPAASVSEDSSEPTKKKVKTKATLAAAKKRAKSSSKKK